MAKAASPVRLEASLMQAASLTAARHHRSTAEQIEYWASIGRSVSQLLNPDTLLAVQTGLARLKVEPVVADPLDPDQVFRALEQDRVAGRLAASVTTTAVRYQASTRIPGYLEQVHPDGRVVTGTFREGTFVPADPEAPDTP